MWRRAVALVEDGDDASWVETELCTRKNRAANAINRIKRHMPYRCCITHQPWPVATAIWPEALMNEEPDDEDLDRIGLSVHDAWAFLGSLIPFEKIMAYTKEWERVIQKKQGNEKSKDCENFLLLRHDIHLAWARGLIALKPVGDPNNKHVLQLALIYHPYEAFKTGPFDAATWLDPYPNTANVDCVKTPDGTFYINRQTGYRLDRGTVCDVRYKNGDIFEITTIDPENCPLPSRTLLELRFYVSRMYGMFAWALDQEDEDDGDESDEEETM